MQGPAKIATYLGVAMTVLGFALIGVAWNGAAELDVIQGQFPYALSGGLGGLGLIIGGMAVLAIQTQRTITAQRAREMGRLQLEADALIRNMIKPAPGEMIDDETIIDVGNRTVVRTIDRRPVDEMDQVGAPAADTSAAGGYAPRPRAASAQRTATEDAGVSVLEREDEAADDAAWAPQGDGDESGRIRDLLSEVSGVGPAKQQALADRFGTVAALRAASVDELAEVSGISRTLAGRIERALR